MKDFTHWTVRQIISLLPIKEKKHINKKQDQQPEATSNASNCFQLFTYSITACGPPFFIRTAATIKKNSCFTRCCTVDRYLWHSNVEADKSWKRRLEELQLYPLSSFAACSSALSDAAEPSNLWEAMAAWWDMLFLTTSPFLHSVISCKIVVKQC